MKKILIILFAACLLMSGCATKYQVNQSLIDEFSEPNVPDDKTGIYVIRGSNMLGAARGLWVAINDSVVADLSNSSHVYLELNAGINTLQNVQTWAGFGYLTFDDMPGKILYAKVDYAAADPKKFLEFIEEDLGKTMVMKTKEVFPLKEKRKNDVYGQMLLNVGGSNYPIMIEPQAEIAADKNNAVVRFFRTDKMTAKLAFDIWNQDGYIGSTKGGTYFSVKLKPGHHVFISRSELYSVLDADLEAGKEYAVQVAVGMGWTQPHIKLLPIDLRSEEQRVLEWKNNLTETEVNQEALESKSIAERIEMGHAYLEGARQNIASGKASKRELPIVFGR